MSNYYDDIDAMEGFQKTIRILAKERFNRATNSDEKTPGPKEIATILYNDYFKYVIPRGKKKKRLEDKDSNIASITRMVQKHYNCIKPYEVQSNYMYAYSLLFNCSLDYLYGKTNMITPNIEISRICEVTGLSPKALDNIMSNTLINTRDYCDMISNYSYSIREGHIPALTFWNEVLESECFFKLPELYYSMAEPNYWLKQINSESNNLDKTYKKLPSKKKFIQLVLEYDDDFDDKSKKMFGCSLEELYDKDKVKCKEILRDIYYELYFDKNLLESELKNAYSVYAFNLSKFLNYFFEKNAEKYVSDDTIPKRR